MYKLISFSNLVPKKRRIKRVVVKLEEEKEDRINDLPDVIIHHILSFLPSTKEAIRTGILSKRWKNQWTQVPILIFNYNTSGMYLENFHQFIDNTLIHHDCSKINKFHLGYSSAVRANVPQITSIIDFATKKDVEDLILSLPGYSDLYILLEFMFKKGSLVKLRIFSGDLIMPNEKVNWGCLTRLSLERCILTDQVIPHILSGSPLLESLELLACYKISEIVIASKYMKRFVLDTTGSIQDYYIYALQISCPNLEELFLRRISAKDPKLFSQAIGNVLSVSSLLESLKLINCGRMVGPLVIGLKALKRLIVGNISGSFDIEISCPKLEELKMFGILDVKTVELLDLPSSLCAIIEFPHRDLQNIKSLIIKLLQQLHNINELTIGSEFIEILSTKKMGSHLFSPLLNINCLTLNINPIIFEQQHYGIKKLLHISPGIEKLVINVPSYPKKNKAWKNYWVPNVTVYGCLESHLKIIMIVGFGFSERDATYHSLLNFVEFLLKNARVLEKMVVIVKDRGTGFPLQVSNKLLSFPRCSQNATIEVISSS